MIVKMLIVGALGTNCFVGWCEETKEAVVIDPGFSIENEGKKLYSTLLKLTIYPSNTSLASLG
jgi:hypothetical protein